jgi:hypothetical protein
VKEVLGGDLPLIAISLIANELAIHYNNGHALSFKTPTIDVYTGGFNVGFDRALDLADTAFIINPTLTLLTVYFVYDKSKPPHEQSFRPTDTYGINTWRIFRHGGKSIHKIFLYRKGLAAPPFSSHLLALHNRSGDDCPGEGE